MADRELFSEEHSAEVVAASFDGTPDARLVTALADQSAYEHQRLINPETGEIMFWTADGGLDGRAPVELVSDEHARRRLARALDGRGAFHRFKAELHEEYRICYRVGTPSATPEPPAGQSSDCVRTP